jgi:hypothetical protein
MSFIRRRTDGNHQPIGQALRGVTPTIDVHGLGIIGCDFISRHVITKRPVFVEVKDPEQPPSARRLTENELAMQAAFPDDYRVVLTVDQALDAVGAPPQFKPADLSALAEDTTKRLPCGHTIREHAVGWGGQSCAVLATSPPLSSLARRTKRRGG